MGRGCGSESVGSIQYSVFSWETLTQLRILPLLPSLSSKDMAALRQWADEISREIETLREVLGDRGQGLGGSVLTSNYTPPGSLLYSASASVTLSPNECFRTHFINCTSAMDLTLPGAFVGAWVHVFNSGSATITVKDGSTTLCTLAADQYALIYVFADTSAVPQWPTKVPTFSRAGKITTLGNIVFDVATSGLVLKDTDAHYWIFTVSTLGALVATDNGLTAPS